MEKNLTQRFIIIGVVLLLAVWFLVPPSQKLKPGLDIAGGVSMIFEIDDTGLEKHQSLAEEMKRLLQKRVDPKGVYNLVWRVHGRNRLEVQMPLPPPEAAGLREEYTAALDELFAANVGRGALEAALRLPPGDRTPALQKLGAGSANRAALLQMAAERSDQYRAALEARDRGPEATQPASAPSSAPSEPLPAEDLELRLRDATELFEDAVDAVLATNLDPRRFQDVLDMDPTSPRRKNSLDDLIASYPALKDKINVVVAKHATWRARRGGLDGPADLRRLLKGAGVLEFRILSEPSPENVTKYDRYRNQLEERGPRPAPGDTEGWFRIDNPMAFFDLESPKDLEEFDCRNDARAWVVERHSDEFYVLSNLGEQFGLLGDSSRKWRLKYANVGQDEHGRPCVHFNLDVVGGGLFRDLTRRNVGKQLCILVDNVAYSSATIQEAIGAYGRITGDFSQEKVAYLVQTMQAGALPARLRDTPLSERTIGSSLGETNLRQAFRAGIVGLIAVAALMAVYYLINGLIANVALLLNVVLVLAAMGMLGARFTLAGIAGVILTIGMAVDANVLIFERMREEQARGSSLRLIIKNGYDKAFSTIIDANITTLLICVILYYVGSEEIKGFGLTLGWGIVMSLFTALFVTRTIFTLLAKYHLIKEIKMLQLIGVPNIDWYGKRKIFVPLSILVVVIGMALLIDRGKQDILDVEFLGGTNAEVEIIEGVELDDVQIAADLRTVGAAISDDGQLLAGATVTPVAGDPTLFHVKVAELAPARLAALLTEPLEDAKLLERGGVDAHEEVGQISVRTKENATAEQLQSLIQGLARASQLAGENLARANVTSVIELGPDSQKGRYWNVTTTVTNKLLVQHALLTALEGKLRIQPQVSYVFRGDGERPFPITGKRLEAIVPNLPPAASRDVTDYFGGAALYFDQLAPPQQVEDIHSRIKNMRLQPGYQDFPWRKFQVVGVTPAGEVNGQPVFSGVIVLVVDPAYPYQDDPETWYAEFAQQEYKLATDTLDREQALRKVSQFKPQIAAQSQRQAVLALLLSWGMIIGYLWIRFGRVTYGFAGVAAIIHDVLIALAFVGISGWIGGTKHPIGAALLIEDFKINMTIVAAFLTIIGYSINDTIVIFDRIRETRGRGGAVTAEVINQSINQCLSRTLLTSITTFIVLAIMYVFGGTSIRGFNFCMMVGVVTGTYSSIAIASPLLMLRFARRTAPAAAGAR
ncbi:MAG: protein translocase subunit SecD [Planctomycetes bacterium]|nr:protein translocase subunit SecD [Planctomycetota bacterium]